MIKNNTKTGRQLIIEFFKSTMKQKGITVYKLAQLTGLENSTLSRIFNYQTDMKLCTMLKICEALNLRPIYK